MHETTTIKLNHYFNEQQCKLLAGEVFKQVCEREAVNFFHTTLKKEKEQFIKTAVDCLVSEVEKGNLKKKITEVLEQAPKEIIVQDYLPEAVHTAFANDPEFAAKVSRGVLDCDTLRQQVVEKAAQKLSDALINRMTCDCEY